MRKYSLAEIREMIKNAKGKIERVYLHWSAGKYGQHFDDYHINIDWDGSVFCPSDDLTIKRNHTWKRNTNAVGISLCACYDAKINNGYNIDMGDYPVTEKQIEVMAIICGMFLLYGNVAYKDIMTHCEIALEDGYGPYSGDEDTRTDLWYLPDSAYNGQMRNGGDVIRGKALWYTQNVKI